MRKHLYLITEHDNEELIGAIQNTDSPYNRGLKNEEAPIHAIDEDKRGFSEVGKRVHLGYIDINEDTWENHDILSEIYLDKLKEIDAKWLEKSGIAEVVDA